MADTQMKGVKEALKSLKGGGAKPTTTKAAKKTAKKKPTKKKTAKAADQSVHAAKKKATAKKKAAKKPAKKKAAKKPAKKKAAKAAKVSKIAKASSGQGGPEVDLPLEKLNDRERRVVAALNGKGSGSREIFTIVELGEVCWKSKSKAQANSWVRNSLRRLIRGGVVEKVERGSYRIADSGRKKLARAA